MSGLDPLPKMSEDHVKMAEVGKALAEIEGSEGYRAWRDMAFERLFHEIRIACGALSGDEALRSCARLGQILEMIDGLGAGRKLGEQVEQDFRERYEEAARLEQQAGRRAARGGMRAGRSSAPSL